MLLSLQAGNIATAFKTLQRIICKVSLRAIYRSNPDNRTFCGMIASLALLTENDVSLGLENLKEIADEVLLRAIPMLECVELVYVGSEGSPTLYMERPPPKGPQNNLLEGWNNKFAWLVGHSHPSPAL